MSDDDSMGGALWYVSGGGVLKMGPFESQRRAWESMKLCDDIQKRTGRLYPVDVSVWPEFPDD